MPLFKKLFRKKISKNEELEEYNKIQESQKVGESNESNEGDHVSPRKCEDAEKEIKTCPICKIEYDTLKQTSCNCEAVNLTPIEELSNTNFKQKKSSCTRRQILSKEKIIDLKYGFEKDVPTFIKLKKKMNNIKTFYPEVFSIQDNIIEVWAKDEKALDMKQEVLNYDEDATECIWI